MRVRVSYGTIMKTSHWALRLALVPVLAFLVSCKPKGTLQHLGPAPAWTLKDLDGKDVSLAQFKGKVVVLDFWATWCGPCLSEIPGYVKLQEKYGKDGVVIVGASVDEVPPAEVKAFVKDHGMNYVVVMADEKTATAFGATEAIPTTILIDRTGEIRDRKVGTVETDEYEQRIKAAL
jgi:peroxiredoxin